MLRGTTMAVIRQQSLEGSMKGMPRKCLIRHRPEMDSSLEQIDHISLRGIFWCVQIGLLWDLYSRLFPNSYWEDKGMDRSIGIQSYHFSMSQEGAWRIEGICYTYTGPGLKQNEVRVSKPIDIPKRNDGGMVEDQLSLADEYGLPKEWTY
ncbi:hypothetical protein Lal_00023035 [Lupinus albus]|nr:hypothetical protein Lal_00023035 [Lupinus albus]